MISYPYTVRYRDTFSAIINEPPADLPEPQLTDNAISILNDRYVKKGDQQELLETPKQVFWRVAEFVSYGSAGYLNNEQRHQLARDYYLLMADRLFLPNTPALVNGGKIDNAQMAACFVLSIIDSLVAGRASIIGTLTNASIIHQSGGGTGFSFSELRPKGSAVRGCGGVASGPVSFMIGYNAWTEVVKQGGVRRGANMGELDDIHPDIIEFINAKAESDERGKAGPLSNFNISVGIHDRFMEAVKNDGDYDLIAPHTGKVSGALKAKEVFDKIVYNAWLYGDPGLFFLDTVNRSAANPIRGRRVKAPNPCGEQPIYDDDACDLGSIKLSAFYKPSGGGNWRDKFDWPRFAAVIRLALLFLDDAITVCTYPLPEITELVDSIRRVGLGPMGLADLLQLMMIPYDSELGLEVSREIACFFKQETIKASRTLAKERGAFPLFNQSIFANEEPRRNANVSTVAPTGSLSRIVDCEGGIEPTIEFCYVHLTQGLRFINSTVKQVLESRGLWNRGVEEEIIRTGRVSHIVGLPEDIRAVFKVGAEISPEVHVKMQAVWQNHFSESGVSKTINLPESATVNDVARAYWLAYESGCMGITVFREGCARAPMIKSPDRRENKIKIERPFEVPGSTFKIPTPHGNAYFTLNVDEAIGLIEGFLSIGKAGSEIAELTEGLMRLFSMVGRLPEQTIKSRLRELIKQLRDIGGRKASGPDDGNLLRSVCDGIAFCCQRVLDRKFKNDELIKDEGRTSGMFCPECQSGLIFVEGCRGGKCSRCSFYSC